jgi:hypothetical protein
MNAGLAKPIHAIWFIRARRVDLRQSLAAALLVVLPSWLRDHPALPDSAENCCVAQSKNISVRPPRRPAQAAPRTPDRHCDSRVAASELTAQCDTSSARALA